MACRFHGADTQAVDTLKGLQYKVEGSFFFFLFFFFLLLMRMVLWVSCLYEVVMYMDMHVG